MDITQGMHLHSVITRSVAIIYYLIFGSVGDVALLGASALWKGRNLIIRFIEDHDSEVRLVVQLAGAAIVGLFILQIILHLSKSGNYSKWTGPTKPLLFPCRTTHARMFPKKHSFVHSYLLVGIPVGWQGTAGCMVSADGQENNADSLWFKRNKKGWYQINAADYLERGNGHLGLRAKLDAYLKSQEADPSQYPHAYLVTAAKFLGYHFNPVSFWYLYSAERDMTAMVLEVNNTFDERRMYFLTANDATQDVNKGPEVDHTDMENNGSVTKSKPLRRAWPKDFHVSPFNSRKGGYSLVAHDPFAPMLEGTGLINNTINLISSKSHAKLVARIFSQGEAIDPTTMTAWQELRFLSAWWWVGFVTFPRIVKEAAALFFLRKLHVWYRPEPLKQSMGRRADETEAQLEVVFRKYLQHLVKQCPALLAVRYIPSGLANEHPETFNSSATEYGSKPSSSKAEEMEFKVLTPIFYSRFVHYAHDLEALFCELNDNCTISVSRPDLLPKLVFKKPAPPLQTSSYLNYGYFKLIQTLRQRPERIERPMTSSQAPAAPSSDTHTKTDIRDFRISSMDGYVLSQEDAEMRKMYRTLVLRLFVAQKVALGSVDLLWLENIVLRLLLAWFVV